MKDIYIFPALFYQEADGISVEFPDLPGCLSCADTLEEAIANAKEALGLHLYGMEQDAEKIPDASDMTLLMKEHEAIVMLIEVFMPPIREKIVKKTPTIPC